MYKYTYKVLYSYEHIFYEEDTQIQTYFYQYIIKFK